MDFNKLHASQDVVEEIAEEFVFGRLMPPDSVRYEKHLLGCPECQKAVEQALEFIKLLKRAAESESTE